MCSLASEPPAGKGPDDRVDAREQPFNNREIGPIRRVQVSTGRIAMLHGIVLDLDPHLLRESRYAWGMEVSPEAFYQQTVKVWLDRDPVLADAEVRCTGTGLHVLIWFAEPLIFAADAQRERWAGIVQAVQAILPIDPDQPGITALTRPVGSINAKNGATVTRLKEGRPVPVERVEDLFDRIRQAPFRTVMTVLMGAERVEPCPVCRAEGTVLSAGDHVGFCYGSCGKVKLGRFYELFLAPRKPAGRRDIGARGTGQGGATESEAPTEGEIQGATTAAPEEEAIMEEGITDERR